MAQNSNEHRHVSKDLLFENFLFVAYEVLWEIEFGLGVPNARANFFGALEPDDFEDFELARQHESRTNHVRASRAWRSLSALYDYAIDGITEDKNVRQVVLDGAQTLSLLTLEVFRPSHHWQHILRHGEGRAALDSGQTLLSDKLACLADVDVRTVRNAISSGALVAHKVTDGPDAGVHIENASARMWLNGRRGFKPTAYRMETAIGLEEVRTPADFATFLVRRRNEIGLDAQDETSLLRASGMKSLALADLESGVFELPLSVVNPLADHYRLDRAAFLDCVMRTFFSEYYATMLATDRP